MAWHTPRSGGRDCPSPIVVGQFIIVCDMAGIVTCYDAADGHIWPVTQPELLSRVLGTAIPISL